MLVQSPESLILAVFHADHLPELVERELLADLAGEVRPLTGVLVFYGLEDAERARCS